jgi:hypothetical protein
MHGSARTGAVVAVGIVLLGAMAMPAAAITTTPGAWTSVDSF